MPTRKPRVTRRRPKPRPKPRAKPQRRRPPAEVQGGISKEELFFNIVKYGAKGIKKLGQLAMKGREPEYTFQRPKYRT